jgi:hypothetical protein
MLALGFLRYHRDKYPNAKDTVLSIFQEAKCESGSYILKLAAADTLSYYGETSWIPVMKQQIDDPNSLYEIHSKIKIAGRMANCGDYSKLDYVASFLNDNNKRTRDDVIRNLMYFASFGDQQTEEQALELLGFAGKTDADYKLRDVAIQMLQGSENICIEKAEKENNAAALNRLEQKKAKIIAKMKEVAEHNLDSPNEELKRKCQNIKSYKFKDK